MARTKTTPQRGLRQPRAAAQVSRAINSALLRTKKNIGPALAANVDFNVASSSAPTVPVELGRPKPSGGIGVKKMEGVRKKNKNLKMKRLLPQSRVVTVKKNGVALRKMTVRRRSYFPGRRRKVYK